MSCVEYYSKGNRSRWSKTKQKPATLLSFDLECCYEYESEPTCSFDLKNKRSKVIKIRTDQYRSINVGANRFSFEHLINSNDWFFSGIYYLFSNLFCIHNIDATIDIKLNHNIIFKKKTKLLCISNYIDQANREVTFCCLS